MIELAVEVVCQMENEMKWEAGTSDVSPHQMKGEKKSLKFSKCLQLDTSSPRSCTYTEPKLSHYYACRRPNTWWSLIICRWNADKKLDTCLSKFSGSWWFEYIFNTQKTLFNIVHNMAIWHYRDVSWHLKVQATWLLSGYQQRKHKMSALLVLCEVNPHGSDWWIILTKVQ